MSMAIAHLFQTLGLFVAVSLGVAVVLAGLLSLLTVLEPATVRITHPPTRRAPRRE